MAFNDEIFSSLKRILRRLPQLATKKLNDARVVAIGLQQQKSVRRKLQQQ